MKKYRSKSSALVLTVSIALTISFLFVIIAVLMNIETLGIFVSIGIILFLAISSLLIIAMSPIYITLTTNELIIRRLFNKIKIPIAEIKALKRMEYSNLTMTFGSKGYFGFIGRTMDGKMSYVKDRKCIINIDTEKESYLISCESPDQLIAQLQH